MRSRGLAGLAAMVLVATGCSGRAEQADVDRDLESVPADGDPQLSAAAAEAVATHGVPALAVARVSLDDGTVVGVAGTRAHGNSTAVALESRFHLGSDTKAMTAVLVAQLVEAGTLSFDTPIAEVLPEAAVHPNRDSVTIRDVLGHRTGLVDDFDLRALHETTDAVAARREAVVEALRSPGSAAGRYEYANVNYMLAGVIVEGVTATPWEAVIRQQLFEPLQMSSCGFGAPLGDVDPLGHTADGTPVPQDAPVTDNPPALGPAGSVHCTLGDWARFADAMLDVLTGTDTEILTAATAADLFAGGEDYVAGWLREGRDGNVNYAHDGSNTLWYARAVLRPTQRDAVLVASNSGEASVVRAIDELTAFLLRS